MQRTQFATMACSLARSLDLVGEPWTPLILRDVWLGRRRFDEIATNLEISRKVLASRLDTLVREGALERRLYRERPARHEYHLTEKGGELMDVLLALISWGDRWTAGKEGVPMLMRHTRCGEVVDAAVSCSNCGEPLHADEVRLEPGPGAREGWGTRGLWAHHRRAKKRQKAKAAA
ncbi:MAG: winged helix-turn-helix transcriptional regulator [Solirubrobacteraceae bacterium]